jgi:hypothetical protein
VSAVFLVSAVAGATTSRVYVLAALLSLAFIEPEVTVTNTLQFNVVSNGLLIGAGVVWLLDRPAVARSSLPILAVIAGFASMTIVFPAITASFAWIHIHDVLMFGKYWLIVLLVASVEPGKKMWPLIAGSLVTASFPVAAFTILQSFHIPVISDWIFSTYLSARGFTDSQLPHLSTSYSRAYGVAGPINTAVLLAMSLGAWFAFLAASNSRKSTIVAVAGLILVLIATYLTGSRLGVVTTVPLLVLGIVWIRATGSRRPLLRTIVVTCVIASVLVIGLTHIDSSFGQTVETSNSRIINTIPNLLRGQPDPSLEVRIDEYAQIDLGNFRLSGERSTEWAGEYIVLLYRYGLAGFLLVWLIWLLLLVRSVRATNHSRLPSDRYLGIIALVAVVSSIVSATGTSSLLDPSRMTLVLIAVGVTPALGVFVPRLAAGRSRLLTPAVG